MQTCLIVDESSVVRKVGARILFQLGMTVESAGSGGEALAVIAEAGGELPDMVIFAATLPDMPGEQFLRSLRERPRANTVIALGALVESNLGQMTRLKRASANGFIYKPFDRTSLIGWLKPYIDMAA